MRKYILITLSLAFVACSGRLKKSEGDADPAISDNFAELQSSAPIYVSSLVSAFGTTGNYTGSGFLAFYSGSRYFSGVVKEVAAHHFQIMAVVGTYSDSNGSIVTTPKKATCSSWVALSRNIRKTITGNAGSTVITVTTDTATITLPRLNPAGAAPVGVVLEWGCFDGSTGAFASQAWSNI